MAGGELVCDQGFKAYTEIKSPMPGFGTGLE